MSYVGTRVVRHDGWDKVSGRAKYVDDLCPAGTLHAATVRAPVARGKLRDIDVSHAKAAPGVVAVITAADIPGSKQMPLVFDDYPYLARDEIRFHGQPIALVAAERLDQARRAAGLVRLDVEEERGVFDPLEALEPDAPKVHGPDNVFKRVEITKGDAASAFARCDVVVERVFSTHHQVHLYLETQGMLAEPDGRGGVRIHGSMQCPYYVLDSVAAATGLPRSQIQVIQAETGGGFGGKEDVPSLVAAHAAVLCLATGRPVKLVYEREEDIETMSKRHPGWARVRYGAMRDGTLVACDVRYIINGGAYATLSPIVLWRGAVHAAGPYQIENVHIEAVAAATNTVPCGAFRGFGQPQVAFAQESCLDDLARELEMDPAELRRKNILREGAVTATGQKLNESCGLPEALSRVIEASRWDERRASLEQPSDPARRRGLGLSVAYYGVGLGAGGKHLDRAHASVQIEADGSVVVAVGNTEMGQGARSVLAQIAADALGAPVEAVRVLPVDTTRVPDSGPTVASRTTISSGRAILAAASPLRQRLEGVAQRLLGAEPTLSGGRFEANGRSATFAEVVAAAYAERQAMQSVGQWVSPETSFDERGLGDAYAVYAFSATVAEVEVDLETGEVDVRDLWSAIDVGRAVNPDQVEAQIEGGVLQATGYALSEELVLEGGKVLNPNLSGYIIPTALDAPRIHPLVVEAAYSEGPYGAKGFGEVPMIGTPPAIANAVAHAVSGRCHVLPLSPERVLEIIMQEVEA